METPDLNTKLHAVVSPEGVKRTYSVILHAAVQYWGRAPRVGDVFPPDQNGERWIILTVERPDPEREVFIGYADVLPEEPAPPASSAPLTFFEITVRVGRDELVEGEPDRQRVELEETWRFAPGEVRGEHLYAVLGIGLDEAGCDLQGLVERVDKLAFEKMSLRHREEDS